MPQIWLSIEELAELLDEEPRAVRRAAADAGRAMRVSGDGRLHLLLSDAMALEYVRICGERLAGSAETAKPALETERDADRPAPARVDTDAPAEASGPRFGSTMNPLRFLPLPRRRRVA